jgi:transcription initiation factor TFIIIB Brf1 subunit/transcription initiation factor TFIIB
MNEAEYDLLKSLETLEKYESAKSKTTCSHPNTIDNTCVSCCVYVPQNPSLEKEWNSYKSNRSSSNPTRCQLRKKQCHTFEKDLLDCGFPQNIVSKAIQLHREVGNREICRGKTRRGIMFAYIFLAYKLAGNPQSDEILIRRLGIDRKNALKGLKEVNSQLPKSSPVRKINITPLHFVKENMEKLNIEKYPIEYFVKMYESIHNRSEMINRSRPQSIAAGMIYCYLEDTLKTFNVQTYSDVVGLSYVTIKNIVTEIKKINNQQ